MEFEEIFNENGLYVTEGFAEGYCFNIVNGNLFGLYYKNKDDLHPTLEEVTTYKALFSKTFKKVFTRQSLFKK